MEGFTETAARRALVGTGLRPPQGARPTPGPLHRLLACRGRSLPPLLTVVPHPPCVMFDLQFVHLWLCRSDGVNSMRSSSLRYEVGFVVGDFVGTVSALSTSKDTWLRWCSGGEGC